MTFLLQSKTVSFGKNPQVKTLESSLFSKVTWTVESSYGYTATWSFNWTNTHVSVYMHGSELKLMIDECPGSAGSVDFVNKHCRHSATSYFLERLLYIKYIRIHYTDVILYSWTFLDFLGAFVQF